MAAIVIHKWVPTHGIHFIPRFCPQNPAPGAADQPPRPRPVRPYTGIWLRALTGSTVICWRELAFLEIEPRLRRMLAENRAALTHKKKNTACGMKNVLIFQEMLDFSTPGGFKLPKITFLYVLFSTVQNGTLN